MQTNLAENIKYYRKQLGLTQAELARMLYVKQNFISRYENGYSTPDVFTLCRLAEIFEITLDELVDWSSDDSSPRNK